MLRAPKGQKRRFQLVLLKPSHYDDDGYVIQWARAYIPSNTLAVLYTLARDAAQRGVLGPDIAIDITAVDEINSHVKIKKFSRNSGAITDSVCWRSPASSQTSIPVRSISPAHSVWRERP